LCYPESDWLAVLLELEALESRVPTSIHALQNGNAVAQLRETNLDRGARMSRHIRPQPSHSLHRRAHPYESRDRGSAMIDLLQEY
jgi:nitrate reductase assembly molybdenum cofactor insertion protein NarJ